MSQPIAAGCLWLCVDDEGLPFGTPNTWQAFEVEVRPLCSPFEESLLPSPGSDDASEDEARPGTKGSAGGSEGRGVDDSGRGQEAKNMSEIARLCYEDPTRGMLEVGTCGGFRDWVSEAEWEAWGLLCPECGLSIKLRVWHSGVSEACGGSSLREFHPG